MADSPEKAAEDAAKTNEELAAELARLREQLKTVTETLAQLGSDKAEEARGHYRDALKSGQDMFDDLGEQAGELETQLTDAIRDKPLVAVASALGVGFVIALLTRR